MQWLEWKWDCYLIKIQRRKKREVSVAGVLTLGFDGLLIFLVAVGLRNGYDD
jgi:hypothetical protein